MPLFSQRIKTAVIESDPGNLRKPARSEHNPRSDKQPTSYWASPDRGAPYFVVAKEFRKEYVSGTPDFARRAEKARITVMSLATELTTLPFSQAADAWLEHKRMYNRESTIACYQDYLVRLKRFFAETKLADIHIGHIQEYQRHHKKQYHPTSVNHDINTLSQMMRKANLWGPLGEHYQALPLPEVDPPKVMSEAEEDRFFEFAAREENAESWLAYWIASLTNNSTASGKELRMLQLEAIHIDTSPPYFRVPKNMKNPNRPRNIPLNERGAEMMTRLLRRAASLGSTQPQHYLFPLRVKRNLFDPTKPASESWLRYRWKLLVDAAIEAKIISFRIKPHNLRHQSITKLLDNGVPIETVRQIAGHGVDSIVTRQYHHGRMEVMARAMDAIDPDRKKPPASFSTSKRGKESKL